jgi:hypothetical protein
MHDIVTPDAVIFGLVGAISRYPQTGQLGTSPVTPATDRDPVIRPFLA